MPSPSKVLVHPGAVPSRAPILKRLVQRDFDQAGIDGPWFDHYAVDWKALESSDRLARTKSVLEKTHEES